MILNRTVETNSESLLREVPKMIALQLCLNMVKVNIFGCNWFKAEYHRAGSQDLQFHVGKK